MVSNGSPHVDFFRERLEDLKDIAPKGVALDFFATTLEVGYCEADVS